jgi:hypothetical protein
MADVGGFESQQDVAAANPTNKVFNIQRICI